MIPVQIPKVVAFEQTTNFDCGVASVQSIYASLTGIELDEMVLRVRLLTNKEQGTDSEEIKKFLEEKGLVVSEKENMTIEDIRSELGLGRLCLVVYQAWGTEKEYQELESGHYSVIYGVDDRNVYLLDPSIHKDYGFGVGKRKLSLERFLANWRDKNSKGRVYNRWCLSVGVK